MFWFFRKNKEIEHLEKNFQTSFNAVKEDFKKVGDWIKHIDGKHRGHESQIDDVKKEISLIKNDIEEIKEYIYMAGPKISKQVFKQQQTAVYKQPAVEAMQTAVQTAVQTPFLNTLTQNEKVIVWTLLNSELKLSYEDLAALLGKNTSTIRGQINALKRKSEGIIEEVSEGNGKKRLYIPEEMRNYIVKSVKVRVKKRQKPEKAG
jgi:septal ring factor EnvC (AmiA/AmiB activator)